MVSSKEIETWGVELNFQTSIQKTSNTKGDSEKK